MFIKNRLRLLIIAAGLIAIFQSTNAAQGAWKTAEVISACTLAPASIASQVAREYGSESTKLKAATVASVARVMHSAISSYNHRNNSDANKYNIFGLCVNGINLASNIYKLSKLSKDAVLTEKEQTELEQRRASWSYAAIAAKVALGVAESGLAVNLALGGSVPFSSVKQDGASYSVGLSEQYGKFPALSSGALSMLRCFNSFSDATNPKVKLAWIGALLGNAYVFKKDYKNWYDFDESVAQ